MCSIVLLAFMLTLHERTLNRLSKLGEDKPSPLLCLRMHRLAKPVHSRGNGFFLPWGGASSSPPTMTRTASMTGEPGGRRQTRARLLSQPEVMVTMLALLETS